MAQELTNALTNRITGNLPEPENGGCDMITMAEPKDAFRVNAFWELSLIQEITQELTTTTDLPKLIEFTLQKINRMSLADFVILFIEKENGSELHMKFLASCSDTMRKTVERIAKIRYLSFRGNGTRLPGCRTRIVNFPGIPKQDSQSPPSSIFQPLAINNRCFGLIGIGRFGDDVFSSDEYARLTLLAAIFSLALNNALLTERAKSICAQDYLTGLPNRSHFECRLPHEFIRAAQFKFPLACVFVSIDNLDDIADNLGEPVKESVVKEFALLLRSNLDVTDILCRYDESEFSVICPHTDTKGARRLAENFIAEIENHSFFKGYNEVKLNARVGLDCFDNRNFADYHALIESARDKLRYATETGCAVAAAPRKPLESILSKISSFMFL